MKTLTRILTMTALFGAILPLLHGQEVLLERFELLDPGEISGQGGWTLDPADSAKATVEPGSLSYPIDGGGELPGGDQHLLLNGSSGDPMSAFLTLPLETPVSGTTYARFLINSSDKGTQTDPGEFFLRLAGWNIYVAAKFYAGVVELPGPTLLEVDTENGLPLDVTHMVVLRMNEEAGSITSVDLWLNPAYGDSANPDLSIDGLAVDPATITQLELRSQKAPTRVDEMLLAGSWDDVVPAVTPFYSLEETFDGLAVGEINGQEGWAVDAADAAKATVESGSLTYEAENTRVDGGTQHLLLNGSPVEPMNTYLTLPVDPSLDGTTYVRMLFNSADKGTEADPGELFLRLAGWGLYVAPKFHEGIIELPGGSLEVDTTNGLPLDVTHMVVLRLNVEAGTVTSADLWLNPAYADSASPDLTLPGLSVPLSSITQLELRSQKTATRVDELLLAETWGEVVPEYIVPPFTRLEESFDDRTIGQINGQGGWTIDAADAAKAVVQNIGLTYTAADEGMIDGGTKHLAMNGSSVNKMNNWLTLPLDPPLDETTYLRALVYSSTLGTVDNPGELFIRLAGWDAYVAVKYRSGVMELPGPTQVEVNAGSSLDLNTPHLVVLRLNVEAGVVTGLDAWFNPVYADSGAPDLSVAASFDLSSASQLELRSQNTLMRVDQLLLAESWDDVVPKFELPPFEGLEAGFDDLSTGPISGQGDWTINAADSGKATVEADSLTYTSADGAVLAGGTQHLALAGAPGAKMDNWLTLPIYPPLDETTYVRALFNSPELGTLEAPGEFTIRLAGWDLYVSAKYLEGIVELPGPTALEVDTTNGLPLDVTHMAVLRLNVEAGVVTSADFWLNPLYRDEMTPDLTLTGLSINLANLTQIELRSQNTLTRVDELALVESWEEAVPAPPADPFEIIANQFESLETGALNGQDGWTAPEAVVVSESAFTQTTPEGLTWSGGSLAMELPGSTAAPIEGFAVRGLEKDPPNETFYISYRASVSDNGTEDPSELFVRNAGWGIFSALKVTEDAFEVNGETYTEAGLAYDTPVHVLLEAVVTDGVVTGLNGWLNPVKDDDPGTDGDQPPVPDLSVTGLNVSVYSLTGFEVRSQKAASVVDDLIMTEKWAECFLLRQVRLTAVKDFGMNVQFEGQIDDQIGEGLSPHDPEDEPPSIDSIPMIDFQNALSQAFDKGTGGIADFERANVTVTSGLEWPVEESSVSTINQMVIALPEKDIRVTLGENSHVEGGCGDPAPYTYTGKECANPDFLNPAPSVEDGYGLWSIGANSKASSGENALGGFNSFDFDFNLADKLDKVALTYINWDNFQSHNGTKVWYLKPNVRVRATYTNGSEEVVLLSTGFTQQTSEPYNTFFGFEAPEPGFFLKRLELFTKGNSARIWAGIDDLAVIVAEEPDLFTFTFNNEGKVDGLDRPIQAANWDGIYSSAALPLVTGDAVYADLSEGVSDDPTPGHYKAGFLFVSGKNEQPAPQGFLVWSTNTNVVDEIQEPYFTLVNPQTDWYSDPVNTVTNLNELELGGLRELQMRINPRNPATVRYHFAIQAGGQWYVSEESFQHSGTAGWESVSLGIQGANWVAGLVGESSLNLDIAGTSPTVVTIADIGADTLLDTVGIYIDTDDNVGQTDTWARVDSITLSAVPPPVAAPTITEQPASAFAVVGDTVAFSVTVLETENITYQWRKDLENLAGETGSTLTLANVTLADAGNYSVVVTGPGGAAISDAAVLTVYALPVVSPTTIDLDAAGGTRTINVTADPAVDWTAVSQDDWITVVSGASGAGNGRVRIEVAAHDGFAARSGALVVGGTTVTVNQEGSGLPADFQEVVGAIDNGDGTWTSTWFGTYAPYGTDWINHNEHGWLQTGAVQLPGDMLFYSHTLHGWVWTSDAVYPVMYDFAGQRWMYLLVLDTYPFVYDASAGEWILP
ncbi:MAG: immunoglobulin domain-containing protein [Oceanipulchritudo sp.]